MFPVFPALKATFDSVNRGVLWHCLTLKGVREKFISPLESLYTDNRIRVCSYNSDSLEFTTRIDVRQFCSFLYFIFTVVIMMILTIAL